MNITSVNQIFGDSDNFLLGREIDISHQLDHCLFFFYVSRANRLVSPTRFPVEISSESEMRGEEIAAGDVSSPEEGIRMLSDKVMVRQAVVVNHSQSFCISVSYWRELYRRGETFPME